MNLQHICLQAVELCKKTGEFILESRNEFSEEKVEIKGKHNYVTFVDKEAERRLIEGLGNLIPDCGFIAEEGSVKQEDKEYMWVIDPLDGTTNFIHGLPPFCVSVGLLRNEQAVMGIICEPNLKEVFYAWEGSPAFLNERIIQVSDTNQLDNSLIATGFPYSDYNRMDDYMELFKWCMKNTRGVRRLGSAAIDLAYVACGRVDGFFEYGLSPWDVAAGAFIVQQAGGKVTDFSGENDFLFGKEIIAFNKNLHPSFENICKGFMMQKNFIC